MSAGDDMMPLTPEERRAALAAEYALGLLAGSEADEARRLTDTDAGFAAEVRAWHERLAALAHDLPEEAPSPAVRQRLNERLADAAAAGRRPQATAAKPRNPFAWLSGLVAVGVTALALLLLPPMLRGPAAPMAGADLIATSPAPMRLETRLMADGRTLSIRMAEGEMPENRDAELWWIADAQATPVSLGVAPRAGEMTMTLPASLDYEPGVQLAITDEPLGGSPTGSATGPVLAVAPLTVL